jgi:hypothetical protein
MARESLRREGLSISTSGSDLGSLLRIKRAIGT